MPNFKVIASVLKVRSGPGTEFDEATEEKLVAGDIIIAAATQPDDSAWLAILLEDVDFDGYVAREYVQEDQTNYQALEVAKVTPAPPPGWPIFQNQLTKLYGYPREDAAYLKIIDLREFAPHFTHVKDYEGKRWSCRIYGHEVLENPLKKAFGLVVARGLAHELKTVDGCFCIRPMKGGGSPSIHSWGLGPDFNALTNPFGHQKITDLSPEFVMCFAECGFEWGGLWGHPNFDCMHFQFCWTQDWQNSSKALRPRI